jgi:tripartite-type tricarboxylate transporter receptor subunit TctC
MQALSHIKHIFFATVIAGLSIAVCSCPSWAQSAGNTIGRIIVPFAPGGAREMPARAV